MIATVFRRHTDGTVTDVFEDDCVWVAAGEGDAHCDVTNADVPIIMNAPPRSATQIRAFFDEQPIASRIIFTHADGRQAQVTRADFGL